MEVVQDPLASRIALLAQKDLERNSLNANKHSDVEIV
jgi:hypothetical protein